MRLYVLQRVTFVTTRIFYKNTGNCPRLKFLFRMYYNCITLTAKDLKMMKCRWSFVKYFKGCLVR